MKFIEPTTVTISVAAGMIFITLIVFIAVEYEHQHEFQLAEIWENVEIEQDTATWNFVISTTERGGVKFAHPKREEITIIFDGVYDNNPRMEMFICEHGEGKSNAVRYVVHARSIQQISLGDVWKNYQ